MEIYKKEFTYHCTKSTKKCHFCTKECSCEKCRGVCIFSTNFMRRYHETKILKKLVDERFYKNEFAIIRQIVEENQFENEEYNETYEDDETLRLFFLFHTKFDSRQKLEVYKFHTGPFHHGAKEETRHVSTLSKKIVELYHHRHWKPYNRTESRVKKNNELIKDRI